jgi:hypothetical protein
MKGKDNIIPFRAGDVYNGLFPGHDQPETGRGTALPLCFSRA